jgi:hypothetical protein
MALAGLSTAAQKCEAMLRSAAQDPLDRLRKARLLGHLAVKGMTIGVEVAISLGPSPKRQAKEQVADAAGLHSGL